MDLNELVVFTRVAQAGSFSAAARQLGMPKSTVSRKISELEQRIGARLIQRTTRKLGLTDAGRTYFEHTARIVAEVEEAEQAVSRMQAAPRGLIRITAPLGFTTLGPVVAKYCKRHPDVQVDLHCTDRQVDLVEEGYDVAIRAGQLGDSTLIVRSLGFIRRVLVAAPSYCKKHGTPAAPADLAKHACIVFGAGATPSLWTLFAGDERSEVRVAPRLTVNDFEIMLESARAAIGIALVPEFLVRADVRKKRLRRVLPAWCSGATPLQALYPTARGLSPKVVTFMELLREEGPLPPVARAERARRS